jgi:hypothetical protein
MEQSIFEYTGENAKNSFLLIDGEKCVGILAGIEQKNLGSNKRVFSEVFWFVDDGYGRYALWFINRVEKKLKEYGFDMFVMAVLESEKTERIEKMYLHHGFKPIERHYLKALS